MELTKNDNGNYINTDELNIDSNTTLTLNTKGKVLTGDIELELTSVGNGSGNTTPAEINAIDNVIYDSEEVVKSKGIYDYVNNYISNPNLIKNWDFSDYNFKVNDEHHYSTSLSDYSDQRIELNEWIYSDSYRVEFNEKNELEIKYISPSNSDGTYGYSWILYPLSPEIAEQVCGNIVTLSGIFKWIDDKNKPTISSGSNIDTRATALYVRSTQWGDITGSGRGVGALYSDKEKSEYAMYSRTINTLEVDLDENKDRGLDFSNYNPNYYYYVIVYTRHSPKAIKLEFGDKQTLTFDLAQKANNPIKIIEDGSSGHAEITTVWNGVTFSYKDNTNNGYGIKIHNPKYIKEGSEERNYNIFQTYEINNGEKQNYKPIAGLYNYEYFWCNKNLLDNWYFGNPINQKKLLNYSASSDSNISIIDRWEIYKLNTTVNENNYLTFSLSTNDNGNLYQLFSDNFKKYIGKTITYSILYRCKSSNECGCSLTVVTDSENHGQYKVDENDILQPSIDNKWHLYSKTFVVKEKYNIYNPIGLGFYFYSEELTTGMTNTEIDIRAIKAELGKYQTLAHKEGSEWVLNEIPDYYDELERCRRYRKIFSCQNSTYQQVFSGIITNGCKDLVVTVPSGLMAGIPKVKLEGRLLVRGINGYFTDATYSSTWSNCGIDSSLLNIAYGSENTILINKKDGSTWSGLSADSSINNTPISVALAKAENNYSSLIFYIE